MTSSLVGSEMCIRDREKRLASFVQVQGLMYWKLGGVSSWSESGPGTRSVSYTHLTLPTICSV
eukprot:11719150-Prorocentrum_lima.AAC.1